MTEYLVILAGGEEQGQTDTVGHSVYVLVILKSSYEIFQKLVKRVKKNFQFVNLGLFTENFG